MIGAAPVPNAGPRPPARPCPAAAPPAPRPAAPAAPRPAPPPPEGSDAPAPGSLKALQDGPVFPRPRAASGFKLVARVAAAVIPPGHAAVDSAGIAASKCFSQYMTPKSL